MFSVRIHSITDFFFILSNPSLVKCDLFSINLTTSQKSMKSKLLFPFKGYLMKNGTIISYIPEKLVTLKSITPLESTPPEGGLIHAPPEGGLESKLVFPHPKYSIKLFIKYSSLLLWVKIKLNLTASPNLDVLDLKTTTLKQPSASTNPDNQKGFGIWGNDVSGLKTVLIPGKARLKSLFKPLFITAFIATSSKSPSFVRWLLFLIKLWANLNNL